jgi:dTDP-4-dehydrorhamnose reductase
VRILLTGRNGQVGRALMPVLSRLGEVSAFDRVSCDLTDPSAIARTMETARPDIIVNPAAYTAVDRAETDSDSAFAVNARAPGILARLAAERGIPLIHYSTDYVYDGRKPTPYVESDATNPLSVYGASKLEGEKAVRAVLPNHVIVRTSWVFSEHGTNFFKTILRLAGERDTLNIVADQSGTPTSADTIAEATGVIIRKLARGGGPFGTYHLSAAGETSWHGYARYLVAEAQARHFPVLARAINPIPASAYPMAAVRPANSRLDTAKIARDFAIFPPPWQKGVVQVLERIAKS